MGRSTLGTVSRANSQRLGHRALVPADRPHKVEFSAGSPGSLIVVARRRAPARPASDHQKCRSLTIHMGMRKRQLRISLRIRLSFLFAACRILYISTPAWLWCINFACARGRRWGVYTDDDPRNRALAWGCGAGHGFRNGSAYIHNYYLVNVLVFGISYM
jgi:hypothetical protein